LTGNKHDTKQNDAEPNYGLCKRLARDPLTTIALLATAEAQEFLEGIGLSFQPDDAEFAETTHEELYHEQLS
jgi:hypothetical protein